MATVSGTGPLSPQKKKKQKTRFKKKRIHRLTIQYKSVRENANEGHCKSHTFPHLLIPTSLFVGMRSSNAVGRTLMGASSSQLDLIRSGGGGSK